MINKNVADYTNFGGNKTNNRISQAPGGSSSLSLGWGVEQPRGGQQRQRSQYEEPLSYGNKGNNKFGQQRYDDGPMNVMQGGYGKIGHEEGREERGQLNSKKQITSKIGGQHGYNNYNPISYTNPPRQPISNKSYQPQYTASNKFSHEQVMDNALEQQKHKVESSRGQRSNLPSTYNQHPNQQSNQPSNQEGRSCVKIHQQKNNNIFGQEYDYWKKDGHNGNGNGGSNSTSIGNHYQQEKEYQQYQQYDNKIGSQQQSQSYNQNSYGRVGSQQAYYGDNTKNQKTSVKVHNPPGGRSNFTFG